MNPDEFQQRLCDITTQWTAVIDAHQASSTAAEAAQAELLRRYSGAVFRYLLGALRDADTAEELSHEFVVRLLKGDYRRADPQRGRFRDYLKTALINLVNDHFRAQKRRPRALESAAPDPAEATRDTSDESSFETCWREELLERTWLALRKARPNYDAVLRLRVENPDLTAREISAQSRAEFDKPMTTATVRKTLERARVKFADLLVDEVAASLSSIDVASIEAELNALDLLRYCSAALDRRK